VKTAAFYWQQLLGLLEQGGCAGGLARRRRRQGMVGSHGWPLCVDTWEGTGAGSWLGVSSGDIG